MQELCSSNAAAAAAGVVAVIVVVAREKKQKQQQPQPPYLLNSSTEQLLGCYDPMHVGRGCRLVVVVMDKTGRLVYSFCTSNVDITVSVPHCTP